MGDKIYNINSIDNAQFVYTSSNYQELTKQIEEKRELLSLLQEKGRITGIQEVSAELEQLEQQREQLIKTLQTLELEKPEKLSIKENSNPISLEDNSIDFRTGENSKTLSQKLDTFQTKLWDSLTKIERGNAYNIFSFTVIKVDQSGQEICKFRGKSKHVQYHLDKNSTLDMVIIPKGNFLMGPTEIEAKLSSELTQPQQKASVDSFCISKFPITKKQWSIVARLEKVNKELKVRPSKKGSYNLPVTHISWEDSVEFCKRLSRYFKMEFRLPTECEWEYACRAGTHTPFHFGHTITPKLANYDGNYFYRSGPKGHMLGKPNPISHYIFSNSFGLVDMHGNVWEWCAEIDDKNISNTESKKDIFFKNEYSILRGGSWANEPLLCRSASRLPWKSDKVSNLIGFRVAYKLVM